MIKIILILGLALLIGCTATGSVIDESILCQDESCSDKSDLKTVRIPVSDVTGVLNKYTHDANGVEVTYFTIMGTDSEIRTALDACDVCGGALGYSLSGEDVVCKKCGRHFHIDDLGKMNQGGGCWPGLLPHTIVDGQIIISTDDLDRAARLFN